MKKIHYEEKERPTRQQHRSTTTCSKIKICPNVFSIFITITNVCTIDSPWYLPRLLGTNEPTKVKLADHPP
jgi:hypothetical protein